MNIQHNNITLNALCTGLAEKRQELVMFFSSRSSSLNVVVRYAVSSVLLLTKNPLMIGVLLGSNNTSDNLLYQSNNADTHPEELNHYKPLIKFLPYAICEISRNMLRVSSYVILRAFREECT